MSDLFARATVYSGAYEGRAARHFGGEEFPIDDLAFPIFGVRMDGLWLHVGTPEAIGEAELFVADSAA